MTLELYPPHDKILVSPVHGAKESASGIVLPDAYMNCFEILAIGDQAHEGAPFNAGDTVVLNKNVEELSLAGHTAHKIKLDKSDKHFTHVHSIPLNEIAFVIRSI